MNLNYKIAIINPSRPDGLARTVIDGLAELKKGNENLEFRLSENFEYNLPLENKVLSRENFISYAKEADLIFFIWDKYKIDYKLAKQIKSWKKTIYIDGSEVGRDRRYDFTIQKKIIDLKYRKQGAIDKKMLKKCALYFRREKPYLNGIIPLPFGIESSYLKNYKKDIKKDIDFNCIFGQSEYPILRKYVTETLVKFCKKNNFSYSIEKTNNREEFYKLMARSKVGISVGGGGFDTFRFWEILANNCLLLTEKIDIYQPGSSELNYKRIRQFSNLYDFQSQLIKVARFLKEEYREEDLKEEYKEILNRHSSKARVLKILNNFKKAV
ncbi:MAG: glycosyltransferase [Patescibacteria group bacterium]